jgi:hypothetical protein
MCYNELYIWSSFSEVSFYLLILQDIVFLDVSVLKSRFEEFLVVYLYTGYCIYLWIFVNALYLNTSIVWCLAIVFNVIVVHKWRYWVCKIHLIILNITCICSNIVMCICMLYVFDCFKHETAFQYIATSAKLFVYRFYDNSDQYTYMGVSVNWRWPWEDKETIGLSTSVLRRGTSTNPRPITGRQVGHVRFCIQNWLLWGQKWVLNNKNDF